MQLCATFLLLALQFTRGYQDGVKWKLAFNIHPADGHSFGYGVKAWEDDTDVGTDANAFGADYKSSDATLETANFIAIVRHRKGVCEAARVWEFLASGKTLRDYLDISQSSRFIATYDNHSFSDISPTMKDKNKDPIFAVDGALVFNWWHSNDGVRIGNSKAYCKSQLPEEDENSNDYWGLGNEVSADTKNGGGSSVYWFDVGIQDCGMEYNSRAQGSDHGTSMKDGTVYGQYAVYVSDEKGTFPCDGIDLQVSIYHKSIVHFNHIDKGDDKFLNYNEVVFDTADSNQDGVLSFVEYVDARAEYMLGEIATAAKVQSDFKRVDKDNNGELDFFEIVFDSADANKDEALSLVEYAEACAQEKFGESGTDRDVVNDFERIDKDGDGMLNFLEMVFDDVDADKDGELSKGEYSQAHPDDSFGED